MASNVFFAYDKVLHTQYDLYTQYANLTAGTVEALPVVRGIGALSAPDVTVHNLYKALNTFKNTAGIVPVEYSFIIIRDITGEAFDIYFFEEDSIFLDSATAVPASEVHNVAEALMRKHTPRVK